MIYLFTDDVKNVITCFAKEEADYLHHHYIGPEHILLALLQEKTGIVTRVLKDLNVNIDKLIVEIETQAKRVNGMPTTEEIRYTPHAHKVIDYSRDEAYELGRNYLGTEHLLLGLIKEGEGIPAKVLESHGVTLDLARTKIKEMV